LIKKPDTLQIVKSDNRLKDIALIKQSRLSVMPVKKKEYDIIISLGKYNIK